MNATQIIMQGEIATQTTVIAQLQEQLFNANQDIAKKNTAIDNHVFNVDRLEKNVATQASVIQQLEGHVRTKDASIVELKDTQVALQHLV